VRICWEHVLCSAEGVGIRVNRTWSSPTTIVIKRVWRWRCLRCYMVIGAEPRCFRVRLGNGRFLDPTYGKKPRDKFVWWERACGLRSQDRRAMPTIGKENWVLKLKIAYSSRHHLWGVYDVSRYEASSHLSSFFVHSRQRKREKKNLR
jgi:hypothetical protein